MDAGAYTVVAALGEPNAQVTRSGLRRRASRSAFQISCLGSQIATYQSLLVLRKRRSLQRRPSIAGDLAQRNASTKPDPVHGDQFSPATGPTETPKQASGGPAAAGNGCRPLRGSRKSGSRG